MRNEVGLTPRQEYSRAFILTLLSFLFSPFSIHTKAMRRIGNQSHIMGHYS